MAERPIIFNDAEVRAVLDGRKTQTRRIVNLGRYRDDLSEPHCYGFHPDRGWCFGETEYADEGTLGIACPFGVPGDVLWVRECWGAWRLTNHESDEWEPIRGPLFGLWSAEREHNGEPTIEYRATSKSVGPWLPSVSMPRWASRLTLRVTSVRVERLQDITEEDACAESAIGFTDRVPSFRESFADLWWSTYGEESWTANPWVWVVKFERIGGDRG